MPHNQIGQLNKYAPFDPAGHEHAYVCVCVCIYELLNAVMCESISMFWNHFCYLIFAGQNM